jgi:hypothetical protein
MRDRRMKALEAISFKVYGVGQEGKVDAYVHIPKNFSVNSKDIVCSLFFINEAGSEVSVEAPKFRFSDALNSYYVYLDTEKIDIGLHKLPTLVFPDFAVAARLQLTKFSPVSSIDIGSVTLLYREHSSEYEGKVFRLAEPVSASAGASSDA